MRRRPLLRALPVAGSLALAGCLDRASSALDPGPDDRSTPGDRDPEVRTLDGWRPAMLWLFDQLDAGSVPDGEAAELVGVGSGEDTHWVTVAAEVVAPVETSVTVRDSDGEPLHETTVSLSNTRYVGVMFAHVDRYEVVVETDHHDGTVVVSEDRIDCNESGHAVLLATDGSVESTWATTDMAC